MVGPHQQLDTDIYLDFSMNENVMQELHNNLELLSHHPGLKTHVVVAEMTNHHENMNLAKQIAKKTKKYFTAKYCLNTLCIRGSWTTQSSGR